MRIAIIGWGSLLWNPGSLAMAGEWHPDGPLLPLEFARISGDGRLTAVLYPVADTPRSPTSWVLSAWRPLESVVENLRDRERTVPGHIGSLPSHRGLTAKIDPPLLETLDNWRREHKLDGVVWTNLPANFAMRTGQELTPAAAVDYLRALRGDERRRAEDYIRRVPESLQTPVRAAISEELGWIPRPFVDQPTDGL